MIKLLENKLSEATKTRAELVAANREKNLGYQKKIEKVRETEEI